MKLLKFALLLILTITISCKEEKKKEIVEDNKLTKVEHYACPDKCKDGGGATAGTCSVCKKVLIHNQAFHNNDFLKNGPINVPAYDGTKKTTATPAKPSPARNAKGVYHYTCLNGCNGGSGTADKCKSCGTDLAHNQAYHNYYLTNS